MKKHFIFALIVLALPLFSGFANATIPTITSIVGTTISGSGDRLEVTFDITVQTVGGQWSASTFDSIESPMGNNLILTNAQFTYSGKTLTIVLNKQTDNAYLVNGNPVVVTPGFGKIEDATVSGDFVPNAAYTSSSSVTGDLIAPFILSSNVINQNLVEVLFSENLNPNSVTPSDFTIDLNPVASATVVGSTVSLTPTTQLSEYSTSTVRLVGSVSDYAGNQVSNLISVTTMQSRLDFIDLTWEVNYPRTEDPNDDDGTFSDGSTIKAGEGSEVIIEGSVKNMFSTAMDIEEVEVTFKASKMDDGDTLEEEESLDDLSPNDDDSFKFEFTVPYDEFSSGGTSSAELVAKGRDSNGNIHTTKISFYFSIEKKAEEVTIISASLDETELTCSRQTHLRVVLKNTGKNSLEGKRAAAIVVSNVRLNLAYVLRDIEMDKSYKDDTNEQTFIIPIEVSDSHISISPYSITIKAYTASDKISDSKAVFLKVGECVNPVSTTTTAPYYVTTTTQHKPVATTTTLQTWTDIPTGQQPGPNYPSFSSKSSKFTEGAGYIVMLAFIILLLLVIGILLILNMTKKK